MITTANAAVFPPATAVPTLPATGTRAPGMAEAGGLLLFGTGLVLLGRRRRGPHQG